MSVKEISRETWTSDDDDEKKLQALKSTTPEGAKAFLI